jgi:hypothetical protein
VGEVAIRAMANLICNARGKDCSAHIMFHIGKDCKKYVCDIEMTHERRDFVVFGEQVLRMASLSMMNPNSRIGGASAISI